MYVMKDIRAWTVERRSGFCQNVTIKTKLAREIELYVLYRSPQPYILLKILPFLQFSKKIFNDNAKMD